MKKTMTFLLAMLLMASLAGCGKNNIPDSKNDATESNSSISTEKEIEDKPTVSVAETVTLNLNDRCKLKLDVPQGWRIVTEKDRISNSCQFKKGTTLPETTVSISNNVGMVKTSSEIIEMERKTAMNTNPTTVEEAKEMTANDFTIAYFLDKDIKQRLIAVASVNEEYYIRLMIVNHVSEGKEPSIDIEKEMQNFFKNIEISKVEG